MRALVRTPLLWTVASLAGHTYLRAHVGGEGVKMDMFLGVCAGMLAEPIRLQTE